MKVAFLTESRADWGGLLSVVQAFQNKKHECEVWITGEHLTKNTAFDIKESAKGSYRVFLDNGDFFLSDHNHNTADILFLLGDREKLLSYAIRAYKKRIPIAHISGGDQQYGDLIDEPIRRCLSEFATIHFPSTERSRQRLIMQNVREPRFIYNVGSPFVDALREINHLPGLIFKRADSYRNQYFLVQMHPCGDSYLGIEYLKQILLLLLKTGLEIKLMEPNLDERVFYSEFYAVYRWLEDVENYKKISVINHVSRPQFLTQIANAKCFIGNSSALFLEAQYIGTPCLHIGERNLGREEAFYGHCVHWDEAKCLSLATSMGNAIKNDARCDDKLRTNWEQGAHGDGNSGTKIVEIVEKLFCENHCMFCGARRG